MKIKSDYANAPQWKELTIKSRLPEELKCLDELAHNMWWVWNHEHLPRPFRRGVNHAALPVLTRLNQRRGAGLSRVQGGDFTKARPPQGLL